jgi:hypothetical protein
VQADLVRSRDFWEGPQPLPWLRAHCRFVIICGAMYVLLLITGTTVGVAMCRHWIRSTICRRAKRPRPNSSPLRRCYEAQRCIFAASGKARMW